MNDKIKVIIFVNGGVVQEVRASVPEVDVQIADWDNTDTEEEKTKVERLALESAMLYPIY